MILGFSMITDQMTNHTKRRFVMKHLGHACSTHASTNTTEICLSVAALSLTVSWSISPPRSGSREETRRCRAGDGELMAEIVQMFTVKLTKHLQK